MQLAAPVGPFSFASPDCSGFADMDYGNLYSKTKVNQAKITKMQTLNDNCNGFAVN